MQAFLINLEIFYSVSKHISILLKLISLLEDIQDVGKVHLLMLLQEKGFQKQHLPLNLLQVRLLIMT